MEDIPRDLLRSAIGGDIRAFELIYRELSNFVYRVAARIVRSSADAEEVTQDVFLKVHRNLWKFRFRSSFRTWVYRIAVNTAISRCRAVSRTERGKVEYESVEPIISDRRASENRIRGRDDGAQLDLILEKLNPEQRACLILREIEGARYGEIAKIMGIPINTVRSRLKRAREALLAQVRKEADSK